MSGKGRNEEGEGKVSIRNSIEIKKGYVHGEQLWNDDEEDALRKFFERVEKEGQVLLNNMLYDLMDLSEKFHHPNTKIRIQIKVIAEELGGHAKSDEEKNIKKLWEDISKPVENEPTERFMSEEEWIGLPKLPEKKTMG